MVIFGITVDPVVVASILALVTGGVASLIVQIIKNALKISGFGAIILTAVVCLGCTAVYFLLIAPPFVLGAFLLYSIVVFGEATGYYHFLGPVV